VADPTANATDTLTISAGSPSVGEIDLPIEPGVASYNVTFVGDTTQTVSVAPNTPTIVPDDVGSITYTAVDATGQAVTTAGSIGLTFVSSGTFQGNVTAGGAAPMGPTSATIAQVASNIVSEIVTLSSEPMTFLSDLSAATVQVGTVVDPNPALYATGTPGRAFDDALSAGYIIQQAQDKLAAGTPVTEEIASLSNIATIASEFNPTNLTQGFAFLDGLVGTKPFAAGTDFTALKTFLGNEMTGNQHSTLG
jgi:hypothetical protein